MTVTVFENPKISHFISFEFLMPKIDKTSRVLWNCNFAENSCNMSDFQTLCICRQASALCSPASSLCSQCLKITEKVAFNIASEERYVCGQTALPDRSLLIEQKW